MIRTKADKALSLQHLKAGRILIVQTAFIGDVVLITALIRECRKIFPDSILDVLVIPSTAPLLENNPCINQVHVYNKKSKKDFFKIIKIIKNQNYDLAITPHSSTHTAIILLLAGIKIRLGYNRWFARHLLTNKVDHPQNVLKLEKLLHLLSVFTNETLNIETELFPSDKDLKTADNLLDKTEGKKIVLIAPGSVWETKRWSINHYITLSNLLLNKEIYIVLSGSQSERSLCDHIMDHIDKNNKDRILNLCGKTTLLETSAIIQSCDLVICNDSGTLHLANAMKTRVYAFFGPTVKKLGYFPYREGDLVFEAHIPCRPCGSHGSKTCPLKHHRCMEDIKPQNVYDKVIQFLSQR